MKEVQGSDDPVLACVLVLPSFLIWLLLMDPGSKFMSSCLFCISKRLKSKGSRDFPHFLWGYVCETECTISTDVPLRRLQLYAFLQLTECQDMKILSSTEIYLGGRPTVPVCPGLMVLFLGCWTFSLKLESFQTRGKNQSLRQWLQIVLLRKQKAHLDVFCCLCPRDTLHSCS